MLNKLDKLSKAERAVYNLICLEGLNYKEVAKKLCLEVSTILTHKNSIFEKLDAHSRAELIFKHYSERSKNG